MLKYFLAIAGFLVVCLIPKSSVSQQTSIYLDPVVSYKKGLELFDKEKYGSAREEFTKVSQSDETIASEIVINAHYYAALCAMQLFHKDAEKLIRDFIEKFPESIKARMACFQLGRLYYRQKSYKKAIEWFNKTDVFYLTNDEIAEYYFKLGYSYFNRSDYDNAAKAFYEIKDIDTKYTIPANYYYAHIAYENKNYETALQAFLKLQGSEVFAPVVPYYIVQIYYLQSKYDQLIEYALPLLQKEDLRNIVDIHKLIGDAYYRKSMFKEAIPHLKEYKNNSPVYREDYYELGYALYMTQNYKEAIDNLEKAVNNNDSLAQNTYYHLADCFLKLKDKPSARNSFFFVSRMDFDPTIKEDALYNYAKLSYELSYQPDAINVFKQYIEVYPDSPRTDEANQYLAEIFLTTHNYKGALNALESIKTRNEKIKAATQRVAYYRGVELFNDGHYVDAIRLFDKSLQYSEDRALIGHTNYWRAEALYKLQQYEQAIQSYKDFIYTPSAINLPVYNQANYNLGYCYFKLENYSEANTWFRKYIKNKAETDKKRYNDALLRIADGFFVLRDYYNAVDYYNDAIKNKASASDYALFQRGVIMGIQTKLDDKITSMQGIIDNYKGSSYYDDALYEAASASLLKENNGKALGYFKTITDQYPYSSYVKKALLGIALVYYNQKQDDKAIDMYKKVVTTYPATPEANEALTGIKNVNPDVYLEYIETVSFANVSRASKDSIAYESAETKYMKGNCKNAIMDFGNYLAKYPDGYFVLNARFYKAECEYKGQEYEKALEGYNSVVGSPQNMFSEKSLLNAANIYYYKLKNYAKALEYYQKLEVLAEYKNNTLDAIIGQMRCNYLLQQYSEAIASARKIIASDKISGQSVTEAHLTYGRSAMAMDSLSESLREFSIISKQNSEAGAEAKYSTALVYNKQANYKESTKIIFEIVNQVPSYDYWIAKGFILLADNYQALGDPFQAKHTLKSIIDKYEGEDGLKVIAQDKLNILLQQEEEQKQQELIKRERHEQQIKPENQTQPVDSIPEGGIKND